jgi:hypothetical protein
MSCVYLTPPSFSVQVPEVQVAPRSQSRRPFKKAPRLIAADAPGRQLPVDAARARLALGPALKVAAH